MKRFLILLMILLGLLLYGCDESEPPEKEETPEEEPAFGLSEKELEQIESILRQSPYPASLDDVAEINCRGYDKKLENGELVEDTNFIEYEVFLKDGERRLVSINVRLLEEK